MIAIVLAGFVFGLGLIVAIGAQNAFVLRQGLARDRVGLVVAICALSDLVLIAVGTAGVGRLIAAHTGVLTVVTVLGAAVLVAYAVLAARRALAPAGLAVDVATTRRASTAVVLTALALTWLNPHVYLDTVVLLGSVSATYEEPWLFALGAGLGSIVWFGALGFGARALGPLFARPVAWRVLDAAIAVVMLGIAVGLVLGLRAGH